jgi:hypothetical protein
LVEHEDNEMMVPHCFGTVTYINPATGLPMCPPGALFRVWIPVQGLDSCSGFRIPVQGVGFMFRVWKSCSGFRIPVQGLDSCSGFGTYHGPSWMALLLMASISQHSRLHQRLSSL